MDVEIILPTDQKKTPPHDVASSSDCGNDYRASSGDLKEYQLPVTPRTPPPRNKTFPFKTMSKSYVCVCAECKQQQSQYGYISVFFHRILMCDISGLDTIMYVHCCGHFDRKN